MSITSMTKLLTFVTVLANLRAVEGLGKAGAGNSPQAAYQQKSAGSKDETDDWSPPDWQQVKKVTEKFSETILNEGPKSPAIVGGLAPQASAKDKDAFCNQTCRLFWEFVAVFAIAAKLFADRLRAKLVKEGKLDDFDIGEEKSAFDKTVSMVYKKTGLTELNQAGQMLEMAEKGISSTAKNASENLWGAVGNAKRWALLQGDQGAAAKKADSVPESRPHTENWKQFDKEKSKRELHNYQKEQQSLDRKVAEMKQMLAALQEESPADDQTPVHPAAGHVPEVQKEAVMGVKPAALPEVVQLAAKEADNKNAVSVLRASEMDLVDALCDMTDSEDEED